MPEIQWLFSRLDVRAVLDILIVSAIIYLLLGVAKGTRSALIIRGLVIVSFVMWLLSRAFELTAVGFLLSNLLPAIILAIPIIFQPELRRLLEQIGHTGGWLRTPFPSSSGEDAELAAAVDEIARAAAQLSRSRTGALIVIERETGLQDYIDRGVPLDAKVTASLLISMFYPKSPLHDGAAIIRGGKIMAATVVLPLTENLGPDNRLGTRHRAAIGITEESDAIAVVVSEETGRISVAYPSGRLIENLDQERLRRALRTLLRLEPRSSRAQRSSDILRRSRRSRARDEARRREPVRRTTEASSAVAWDTESDA
ncbi:MAG TPA: diadenylate cyclase CdaA [Thermomicrobiales bacterium]|nr:diadenylate cyclase CdaA [Thermomicrobiales bacterium]